MVRTVREGWRRDWIVGGNRIFLGAGLHLISQSDRNVSKSAFDVNAGVLAVVLVALEEVVVL